MEELLARMRAALRHQLQVQGERPVFRVGDLSVDLVRRIVKVGDKEVKLSPKEYDLLRMLVQHAGKVLTHQFLLSELWDELDRRAISARLRPPAPAEDRGRSGAAAIHPDRDRHRLPPARAGLSNSPALVAAQQSVMAPARRNNAVSGTVPALTGTVFRFQINRFVATCNIL